MKELLISSILLFAVGLEFSCGHSIRRPVRNASATDVYAIKEDSSSNTITFVGPKPEKPTLREIVYYHVVERPYSDSNKIAGSDGPDLDDSVRPFTNSHGFQFLDTATDNDSINDNLSENITPEKDEVEDEYNYYDEDPVKTDVAEKSVSDTDAAEDEASYEVIYEDDLEGEIKDTVKTVADEVTEEVATATIKEKSTVEDLPTTTEVTSPEKSQEADIATEIIAETTTEKQKELQKKVKHRKLLFDIVKEKYYSKKDELNSTAPAERNKREIRRNMDSSAQAERKKRANRHNMRMPDAPRLGDLNYDRIPPYLRTLISTESPPRKSRNFKSTSSEDLDELKLKMRDILDSIKGGIEDVDSEEFRPPKTYGMNMTGDDGYVWNDMWSDPGVHFNVQGSESVEEKLEPTTDKNNDNIKDDKPADKGEDGKKELEDSKHDDDDDIEVIIKKDNKHRKDHGHKEKEDNEGKNEKSNIGGESRKEHKKGKKNTEEIDDVPEANNVEAKSIKEHKKGQKDKEGEMKELLNNEQFWKWLADWTSVYMEVLTERIKEQVKEEVSMQIKKYTASLKKDHDKKTCEKQCLSEKKEDIGDKLKPFIKDDKLYIDGKIIPIVHKIEPADGTSGETKGDLKRKKNKVKPDLELDKESLKNETSHANEDKKELPVKIEAQNLYGNSVGSDKVTNIFIFYPSKESDNVMQDVKPANLSDPNEFVSSEPEVTIDKRIRIPDEEKETKNDVKETTTVKPVKNQSTEPTQKSEVTLENIQPDEVKGGLLEITSTTERLSTELPKDSEVTTTKSEGVKKEKPSEVKATSNSSDATTDANKEAGDVASKTREPKHDSAVTSEKKSEENKEKKVAEKKAEKKEEKVEDKKEEKKDERVEGKKKEKRDEKKEKIEEKKDNKTKDASTTQ